jgi:hypothetical protein
MTKTKTISNMDDTIDSREVIARIEELEESTAVTCALCDRPEDDCACTGEDKFTPTEPDEDDVAELKALQALASEAEGYAADWKYGETLIRDSYFREYAEQLAEDIGAIEANAKWPNNCIDWDQAARELRMDYTSVEFDGVTYWVR